MTLERRFLIIAVISVALAAPVTYALKHRADIIRFEKSQNSSLQIQLQTKQQQIEKQQLEQKQLQQKNDDLQKQLQSKRDSATKVAQAHQAPVVIHTSNCNAYAGLVGQYGWDVRVALAIMRAESGCDTGAVSRTCDHGLMQINCVHADMVGGNLSALHDPATNISVAYRLYASGGWSVWTTYTSGAYLQYL